VAKLAALALVAVLAAFFFGKCEGAKGAQAQARIDSVSVALAYADSVQAVRDSVDAIRTETVDSLTAVMDSLRPSAPTIDVDTVTVTDTVEVRVALTQLAGELNQCHAAFTACDSANAILRLQILQRDTVLAERLGDVTSLRNLWEDAERRAKPKPCGLGGSVGYGVTLSGGQVFAGPSLAFGFSCRLKLF